MKSPKRAKLFGLGGGAAPFFTINSTLPAQDAELFFISSSRWLEFTATTSASSPPCLVDPTQPMQSTDRRGWMGTTSSDEEQTGVHPREICHFSDLTFS